MEGVADSESPAWIPAWRDARLPRLVMRFVLSNALAAAAIYGVPFLHSFRRWYWTLLGISAATGALYGYLMAQDERRKSRMP